MKNRLISIVKRYPPEIGGVEATALEINKIAKKIFKERIVITYNNENKYKIENFDDVEVHRLPTLIDKFSVRYSLIFNKILKKVVKENDVLLYHYASGQPELEYLFQRKIKRNKVRKIIFYHMDVSGRGFLSKLYNRYVESSFFPDSDKIIVTSPNMKVSSPVLRTFQNKIEIIPLFVDLKHFYYRKDNKREFLLNKFKNKKEKIVMYIGRLGRYKGLDYLVKSYKYLDKKTGIVIIGNGPKEKEIKELVYDLNFSNDILFLNHVPYPDLPSYYSAADVFVLPSTDRGEAFGLVVIEAMACGIPVITTELGTGTSYHNIDGVTGRVIPPKNEEEIAKAIKEILFESPERYKKENIIKRAAEFSYENFEKNVVEKILS